MREQESTNYGTMKKATENEIRQMRLSIFAALIQIFFNIFLK